MAKKTNVQLIANIMNYSEFGALSQVFVLNAIEAAASATAQMDPAQMPKGFINPEAWVGVAKEIQQKIKENMDERLQADAGD